MLCRTPLVLRGDIDGKVLTMTRAGVKGSNFFMRDSETGSDWQQATGECFDGPMKGKRLIVLPFAYTTWKEWRTQHPKTLALVPEPAYKANYDVVAERNVDVIAGSAKAERGTVHDDDRLPPHEMVVGLELADLQKAYPTAALKNLSIINDQMGATPVVLVYSAATDSTTAFSRKLGTRTLTFQPANTGTVDVLIDKETSSKWTPYGECTSGKLKGKKLDVIVPQPGFWFAWSEFYPKTEIFTAQ